MIDWEGFKTQMQANPRKMLGYVLGIAACFLVIWMLFVIQVDSGGPGVQVEQSGRLDSLRLSMGQSVPPSSGEDVAKAASPRGKNENTPFSNILPTFLILLSAIGGLWYWIKRGGAPRPKTDPAGGRLFQQVGSQPLPGGQEISVININGEYWVLAGSGQGLQLLHRFAEEEWRGPENIDADHAGETSAQNIFSRILQSKKIRGDTDNSNGSI